MTDGIAYAIAGDEQIPKLLMSVRALRRVSSLPVVAYAHLSERGYADLSDARIPYVRPPSVPSDDNKRISRFLKTSIHQISPFDRTAYFDNDIVTVRDPSWIFERIPKSGIIFGWDAGKTIEKFSKYACPGRGICEEISRCFGIEGIDPYWPIWNGGLYVFNRDARDFLQSWHHKQLKVIGGIGGWSQRDQGTLIATVWEFGLQGQECFSPGVNFLHGLHRGLRRTEEGWVYRSGSSDKPVTNIHLCLSWGNTDSETWRTLCAEMSDFSISSRPDSIVVPCGRWHEPFEFILDAISQINLAAREDRCGFICQAMASKMLGKHNRAAAVLVVRGKLVVIDYHDLVNASHSGISGILKTGNFPDLILKCQFRPGHESYKWIAANKCQILPFMYPTVNDGSDYLPKFRQLHLSRGGDFKYVLFGRLASHGPRKKIPRAIEGIPYAAIKLVGLNRGRHQQWNPDGRLARDDYFSNMADSMFCLDGPGKGNLTHRLVEGWAMQQPVICPVLKNSFYVPVNPGEHYIPVEKDYSNLQEVVEYYQQRYDLALEIARNGAEYYDKYCTKEGIARLFLQIMKDHGIL